MNPHTGKRLFVPLLAVLAALFFQVESHAVDVFAAPESPRSRIDFNSGWKFIRQDVPGAEAPEFNDSDWQAVSTPHSFNDVDTFRRIISHSGGDRGGYKGLAWYRKTFKLPSAAAAGKVFIEFEGMRQAGDIYLNGKAVGLYENGVTGYGIDITSGLHFGDQANVLAVKVDNRTNYMERATNAGFEWNANDFNPDHGGINRRVWLHLTGKIHQTLPLYYGLETTGTYIHADNYDIPGKKCDLTVDSQAHNETSDRATATLSVIVVDKDGAVRAKFDGDGVDMVAGEKTDLTASGPLTDAHFWSTDDPYLYDVYSILKVDDKVVDVTHTTTGFRKAEFKGGAGTGGIYINDKFVYLKGFAQRSSDEWAGVGAGYPEWMHDLTAQMIHDCHGNYVRWMHVSPQKVDVEAFDRYGIIETAPAGDKERDATGRQWEQRMEVMRDSIIYFRNSPSILFWEAGNNGVTADHMKQMVDLKQQWDPSGMRVIGCRTLNDPGATPIAEYFGVMIGQDPKTDNLKGPTDMFRAYSAQRRDRAPFVETEDFRDEGARRFWDNFSPPHFGFKKGPNDTYDYNSESFALAQTKRYWEYWSNRISNTNPAHAKWSGYASIYFSDSNADGRQDSSEVCRVSGKVDAVRLPKEIYFAERVMQSEQPDIHILGHWTYPAGTTKPMYVIANNVDSVELFVNGKSKGKLNHPQEGDGYVYEFPNIQFEPGTIKAVGYKQGESVADQELTTAGPANSIKLTPILGPGGLKANGEDIALYDVEVVDAQGHRCPTDEARVNFKVSGPGIWRGGYNSGIVDSTNNLYLSTECGINRVAIRSTQTPGKITLEATRDGLQSATTDVTSSPIAAAVQ